MKIIANKAYPGMYYAVYPDGAVSADFYNKTRAKEHTARLAVEESV